MDRTIHRSGRGHICDAAQSSDAWNLKCPPLWKRKIIFQTFQTFIFWVPAVKFFRGVPLFFSTFLMEVFQQGFSTVSKYVPLAEALVAQIHQHSMHVSFHSVRLPSPASFSCNRLEKYVLHFCTCLLYLSFLSLPSPISHSFIILLFSSFSYGFLLILIIFFHTYCTYVFAPCNHRTNGKGSSPFFASVGCRKKPCRLRNNYTRSKLLEMLDNEGFANQYNFVQLGLKHEVKSFKFADLSP